MLPVPCLYGNSKEGGWNLKEIEDCLERDSSCVNINNDGKTPLTTALMDDRCSVDVIKVLLRYGADVSFEDEWNDTPLTIALQFSRNELFISLLLEYGANVLYIRPAHSVHYLLQTQSILCIALNHGASKGVVQLLLDSGCPLNSCEHGSALFCAFEELFPTVQDDVLLLLIERGANVNAINAEGYSVMCHALQQSGGASSIEVLLRAAKVLLLACNRHPHPIFCATYGSIVYGDFPYKYDDRRLTKNLVELLLSKSAPLDEVVWDGLSPLQAALKWCIYETGAIHLLLKYYPDVDVVDKFNNNLLSLALWNMVICHPIVVELLIKRGVSVTSANIDKITPLHRAVCNGLCPWEVIELLIKNGASVNVEDCTGETPLTFIQHGDLGVEKIRVLLAAGANIEEIRNGRSPIESIFWIQGIFKWSLSYFFCYFKILLQYNLLKNLNFNIEGLIEGHKDYKTLSKYWKKCLSEVQLMELVTVGENCTLREFLNSYATPSNETTNCKPQVEKYDCNQLLIIKTNNEFPLFSDIISDKVDRWFMEAKLREMQVYTMKCTPHKTCSEEKIILSYLPVCKIVQYLVDDDLLKLIVAYTFMDGQACKNNHGHHLRKKKKML